MKPALIGIITLVIIGLALVYVVHNGSMLKQGFQDKMFAPNGNVLIGETNPRGTFTLYYADWCPHCKTAKPEMEELVAKSPITVGNTKCAIRMIQPEEQPEEAKGKPVKGFPTFLLETTAGETVEYKGKRNAQGYLDFLNEKLGLK
jgi:thiol-disulfide isomerase/thioredoxin